MWNGTDMEGEWNTTGAPNDTYIHWHCHDDDSLGTGDATEPVPAPAAVNLATTLGGMLGGLVCASLVLALLWIAWNRARWRSRARVMRHDSIRDALHAHILPTQRAEGLEADDPTPHPNVAASCTEATAVCNPRMLDAAVAPRNVPPLSSSDMVVIASPLRTLARASR